MLADLLPGLRNLRSGLLTGSLLLGSLYAAFGEQIRAAVHPRPTVAHILEISPWMPLVLIGLSCYLVGSLYVTGLEGIVDWVHRKRLLRATEPNASPVYRRILLAISPLSEAARGRLVTEADRFFDEQCASDPLYASDDGQLARAAFRDRVLADVLWLEGKLAGSPLQGPYDQYRSEGELRLGTALLMPFVAAAAGYALQLSNLHQALLVSTSSVLAMQFADFGLYYFRRAHSFIAHHIADGTLLTPSMETLKRSIATRNQNVAAIPRRLKVMSMRQKQLSKSSGPR